MIGPLSPEDIHSLRTLREKTRLPLKDVLTAYNSNNRNFEVTLQILQAGIGDNIYQPLLELPVRRLFSYIHNGRIGAMVEMGTETDFAANSIEFAEFGKEICFQVVGTECSGMTVEELMASPSVREPNRTTLSLVTDMMKRFGENIGVIRFVRYEAGYQK